MNAKRTGGRPVGKLVGIALVLFVAGILVGRAWLAPSSPAPGTHEGHEQEEAAEVWTCSMHPQVRLPSPGKCPICRMDLVQVESGAAGEDGDAPRLEMSEAARVLAEIETAPVVRDRPRLEIRMTGKAEVDETRVHALSARVAGRLDRMFVDYTGLPVRAGDHLAEIYSPELLAAQEELLQVVASRGALSGESTGLLSDTATATVEAAREKLRLYGLTEEQIKGIERRGETEDHVTLFADHGGIVIEKNAVVGDYVRTGTTIYRIADLSRLWVVLDAHESDLAWLRSGQEVEFDAESLPGRIFTGRVSFIAPAVEEASRTVRVRINVDNSDGLLKPGMFVRAVVYAEVASDGTVVASEFAGRWVCPMHPEVVGDAAGSCDECGMDLVPAEEMGLVSGSPDGDGPLVVPVESVLRTGRRAIVYVEVPDAHRPSYEGREVGLGPRAGDVYIVQWGLEEGERVVSRGNFKIDSALQIQAKPSMMSPGDGTDAMEPEGPVADDALLRILSDVYSTYFELQMALAGDDATVAAAAFARIGTLTNGNFDDIRPGIRPDWKERAVRLGEAVAAAEGVDIAAMRVAFEDASKAMIDLERTFGHAGGEPHHVTYCPMAFDFRGAYWLQDHERIDNPYFGASMLRCGSVEETVPGAAYAGGTR